MARRFKKGRQVTSLSALIAGMYRGQWFYLRDKPQNVAWLSGMTVRTLQMFINSRLVWKAVERKNTKIHQIAKEGF